LPILALEPDLDRYYYDSVIGGPGAFVIAARGYETFGEAILRKLVAEIAANGRRISKGERGDARVPATPRNFTGPPMLSR